MSRLRCRANIAKDHSGRNLSPIVALGLINWPGVAPQPLFEHNQAEQDLMVVSTSGIVLLQQICDGTVLEITVDERLIIGQILVEMDVQGLPEPVVDHIDGKPPFLSPHDLGREKLFADPAMEPFPDSMANFE